MKNLKQSKFHPCKGHKGVLYLESKAHSSTGKAEKTFYIRYRTPKPERRPVFERIGRSADGWTAAKADDARRDRMRGMELPNTEQEQARGAAEAASEGRMTFDRIWKKLCEDDDTPKKGLAKRQSRYDLHIKDRIGDKEPKDLISDDIDDFRKDLSKRLAAETTRTIIGMVKRIARYGETDCRPNTQGLQFIISLKGKALGRPKQVKLPLDDVQIGAWEKAANTLDRVQERAFCWFVRYTGLRRSSAQRLKWEDVHLKNSMIVLRAPKIKDDLPILIDDDTAELLRNHPRVLGNPYVFAGSKGKMLHTERITRITRRIRNLAGIPATHDPNHMWRKNLATQGRKAGIPDSYTAARGGWKTVQMVGHYAEIDEPALREAVAVMERARREAANKTTKNTA